MLNGNHATGPTDRERSDDRRTTGPDALRTLRQPSLLSICNHGFILPLIVLSACGSTGRFVEQPNLTIDQPQMNAQQGIAALYGQATPYVVKLCEADPASKECKTDSKGITATGIGGLLLPLTLHVRGMVVSRERQSAEGLVFDASLDATVDAISPWCATVKGQIVARNNNTATLELRNFYCNWAGIGNVIVNADLSIDSIILKERAFTGFYKVTFHGTGNAGGSGYYKAVISPKELKQMGVPIISSAHSFAVETSGKPR
jgi:hypothetical protein